MNKTATKTRKAFLTHVTSGSFTFCYPLLLIAFH